MKTKKYLFALALVSVFALGTFAATSAQYVNPDDDKKVAIDRKQIKRPGQDS